MKDFLYKIRTKITRWMYGRNGQDEFSDACYMAGVVLLVVGMIEIDANPHLRWGERNEQ